MKKAAVILCGCGAMDGSEIHEATFALAALDKNNIEYQCFALEEKQERVVNFITSEEKLTESRIQIEEAARIARGNIKPISQCSVDDYDMLIMPGGFGVAFNLCDFALQGHNATVHPEISALIKEFYSQKKIIGAICIAPALIALTLGDKNPIITAGEENSDITSKYQELGCKVEQCSSKEYITDKDNNIYSTPAYMNNASISQVQEGITKMIDTISKN